MNSESTTIEHVSNVDIKPEDAVAREDMLQATAKQLELFELIRNASMTFESNIIRILYGGAAGGAKTYGWLMVLYTLCKIFPGSRWLVVRKDSRVLRRNTVPSFWKTCPRPFFHPARFNRTELVANASNGSQIIFMGENKDKDRELTAFDGLEINGAIIEDAQECSQALFDKLKIRVGRWKLEKMPPLLIGLSCNPHQGWLKRTFYQPWKAKRLNPPDYFIPALPVDNPYLDNGYIASLDELKTSAPALYRKFAQGSWEAEDDVQQAISWNDIYACEDALDFEDVSCETITRSLGVDVGRNGPDPSMWYVTEGSFNYGYNIIHKEGMDKSKGPEVVSKTIELINEFDIPHSRAWLDTVGVGGFAYDDLEAEGYGIQSFVGGATAEEQYIIRQDGKKRELLFKNLNTQALYNVKLLLEAGRIGGIVDEKLKEDLAAYDVDIKGEKTIWVSSKEDIKNKIGRSPDDGDALKYSIWGQVYDKVCPQPGFDLI